MNFRKGVTEGAYHRAIYR